MKHLYFCVILFFIMPFMVWGQSSFIHLSAEKIDNNSVSYFGDLLTASSETNFSTESELINYNPSIPFDGEQDYMELKQDISDLSQVTIFTVFKAENDSESEAEVWGIHGEESTLGLTTKRAYSSSKQSYYTGVEQNKAVLHTFLQLFPTNQAYPNPTTFISLGVTKKESTNTYFKGSIAEVIAYKKRLRGSQRQKIETALAIKYGITLSNGENYISSNKKVIWDSEEVEYSNNIAGIGRDDNMELYQKQSTSSNEDEFLIISATEKAISNKENNSEFKNGNFLVWGNNNENLLLEENASVDNLALLNRKWLIKATGSKANKIVSQLQIDANILFDGIKDKNAYLLVIDQSGSGDFLPENNQYVEVSSLTKNGVLIFDNLLWDTDKSGKDVFTFALKEELHVNLGSLETLICANATTILNYKATGGVPPYQYVLENANGFKKQWNSTEDIILNNQIEDISKGDYTLTVSDYLGTTTQVLSTVEEEIPVTVDLGGDRQLKFEEEIILEVQISNPERVVSYNTTRNNSDFLSEETTATISEAGDYTLIATTELGCEYSDAITVRESKVKAYTLYPNPSTDGNYSIDIELADRADIMVSIYNLLGVRVANFTVENQHKATIQGITLQQAGVYEVIVQTPHETISKKLIVQ